MSASRRGMIGALALAVATSGCAATTAPPGWLPSASTAGREGYGAWVTANDATGGNLRGEFIAVTADTLFVLPLQGALRALPLAEIHTARVTWAACRPGAIAAWAVLGTLSTLSHGVLLLISAPVWILAGTASTVAECHANTAGLGGGSMRQWVSVARYARFPQGIPPDLDRATLTAPSVWLRKAQR